ncbi:FAD-dependent monooxygenase [Bacillus marasmi]|uniref:FAD-dependent monooxygenase n=1 Tax=Bacillus marasmi TaxID=1926279 RepID=UPI0011CB6B04|nr:FAD-dependent monooxygenase [Bacillus marasmi]
MGQNTFNVDVCIVGAGPSGALLGLLLAKNGVSTLVLERTSGKSPEFRGEHISAETEGILTELGLFDKIEEKGLLRMKKVEYIVQNRVIKEIAPRGDEEHVGIHVPQAHLMSTIIQEAKHYKQHFQILFNAKATGLIQDDHLRYCGVKATLNQTEVTINCSVVTGADGRFSTVRKLANIPVEFFQHGYDVLWAKITALFEWKPTVRMLLVNDAQLALFTQTGGFVQIGWNIEKGSFSELKKAPFRDFIQPLVENVPELKKTVERELHTWNDLISLDVFSSKSPTWVKDGLMIIGDAAHTMTPTAAIGINTGMIDAYVLAPLLSRAIKTRQFDKETLSEFEVLRRDKVELLQEQQIIIEKSYKENFNGVVL